MTTRAQPDPDPAGAPPARRGRASARAIGGALARSLGRLALAAAIIVGLALGIPWLIDRLWR